MSENKKHKNKIKNIKSKKYQKNLKTIKSKSFNSTTTPPPPHSNANKCLCKLRNKIQHSYNGNIDHVDDLCILQINTGNGTSKCNDDKLRYTVEDTKAKLVIVSESNIDTNNLELMDRRAKNFPGFRFFDKTLPGSTNARLSIYVSKELEVERMSDLENNINSTAVLRIRRKRRKWTYVIGSYRQWKGTSELCPYNSRNRQDCLRRFKDLLKIYTAVLV